MSAITERFDNTQLDAMFDPSNHIGVSLELVDEAVAAARSQLESQ